MADDSAPITHTTELDALDGRVTELEESVAALARHGASDVQLEAVRQYAEGLAARLAQLERRADH